MITHSAFSEAYTELVQREGLYYKKFSDEPFTGKIEGNVQTDVRRGQLHGSWLKFDDDGQLIEKGFHEDGKRFGKWEYFSSNGRLSYTQTFKDGVLDGLTEHYTSNGKLSSVQNIINGITKSSTNYYYQEGILKAAITSEAAVRHGTSIWYYRNGKVKVSQTYNQGKLNGESIEYDHLGNVKSRTEYLNGNKNGEQHYYYLDGTLKTLYRYEQGVLSYAEQFHNNGKLKEASEYLNGKLHGKTIELDSDGKITATKNYLNHKIDGEFFTTNLTDVLIIHDFFPLVVLKTDDPVNCTSRYSSGQLEEPVNCIDENNTIRVTVTNQTASASTLKEYDNFGRILVETQLHASSADTTRYYPNGNKKSVSSVSFATDDWFGRWNSKKNGDTVIYSEDGNIIRSLSYKDGNLEGKLIYKENGIETVVLNIIDETFFNRSNELYSGTLELYNVDNTLYQSGSLREGKKTGEWLNFDNNGLSKTSNYAGGKKNGLEVTYFTKTDAKSKRISSTTLYDAGDKTGEFSRWFDNGQLAESGQYSNNKKSGLWRYYTKKGQITKTGRFDQNGKETGIWDYWFDDGQQKFSKRFKDGNEIGF